MKLFRPIFALIVFMSMSSMAWADKDVKGSTDGKLGELLSAQLYCNTKGMVEGNIGLVVGILIMFSALWSLARGGKVAPAIISIFFGASITALPTIIESGFKGLGQLMGDAGMTATSEFKPPSSCDSLSSDIETEYDKRKVDVDCKSGGSICM